MHGGSTPKTPAGLERASATMGQSSRELGCRLRSAVAASTERGVLAFKRGYASWSEGPSSEELAGHTAIALRELRDAGRSLG